MNQVLASIFFIAAATAAFGCKTEHKIVVEQPKPLEVNINLSGRLELVIEDAREDVAKITGQKPRQTVRPEDIGLPAGTLPKPGAAAAPGRVILAVVVPLASEDQLKQAMAARNAQVRQLLDAKVAGEAHTGLLAARGQLSADQQQLMNAENSDRSALYAAEAKRRGVTAAEVALAYYMARLEHAKKGDWYEKYDQAAKAWVWRQWGVD